MNKGLLKKIMNDLRNGSVVEITSNGGYSITFSPYAGETGYDDRVIEIINLLFEFGVIKRKKLVNLWSDFDCEYRLKSRIRR